MSSCHFSAVQHHRHFVAYFHVGGAGDDLDGLPADVHLADNQLVRIGMALDGQNLSYHDFLQVLVSSLEALHLRAGQGHRVAVLLIRAFQLGHICLNP